MAVKATAEITLRDQTDAEAIILWHYVSTSATKPDKPTTTSASATPSGWSKSEPSVSADSDLSKYDYTSLQTVWGDGTCDWGDVNLSASYEAAKRAWNKAGSVENELNNLEIGGRNLLLGEPTIFDQTNYKTYRIPTTIALNELSEGDKLTIQFWGVNADTNSSGIGAFWGGGSLRLAPDSKPDTNGYWSAVYTVTANHLANANSANKYIEVYNRVSGHSGMSLSIDRWKLEKGNKPTDWTPAPEDLASATDSVEYIAGTQTAATGSWTGVTRDSSLYTGKTIAYRLPFAGSGGATLNLTLSGGETTGAKTVLLNTNNSASVQATTHYGAGSIIQMTYDGTSWRVAASYYDTSGITNARYRTQYANAIKAATGISAGRIICGTSAGYKSIDVGITFDLSYPLLYAASAISSGSTGTNNYLSFNGIATANNGTISPITQYSTIFLKGTVTGNTFKIASSPFMTCATPSSEDGYCYIPLGIAYSTAGAIYFESAKDIYAYKDGAFGPVSIREASAASKTATYYITDFNSGNGVTVHPRNDTSNRASITPDGMEIFKGDISVAKYSEVSRIGQEDITHVEIEPSRFGILHDSDRLYEVKYEGALVSIYGGGSTAAEGYDYSNMYIDSLCKRLNDGYTVNTSTNKVLMPSGADSGMTVVSAGTNLYSLLDSNGNAFESGYYAGILYSSSGVLFSPDVKLSAAAEDPGAAIHEELGGVSIDFADSRLDLNGIVNLNNSAEIKNSVASTDTFFIANRTDTGHKINFGVGSGGTNRGIWDSSLSKWIIYVDSNGNTIVNGLTESSIPSLAADKITSGTFAADRIPSLAASKIGSGTLAVARGGTGAATATANYVFAGPNGSSGAPSFRKLVAADLPNTTFTSLGTTTGTTALTIDCSAYVWILVRAYYSTTYWSTIIIPTGQLNASTYRDFYLGGGTWSNDYGASFKAIKTNITPYKGRVAGVDRDMQWQVWGIK